MGGDAAAVEADGSGESDVWMSVDSAERRYTGLAVLVSNAAVSVQAMLDEETIAGWTSTLQTNPTGPFLSSDAAGWITGEVITADGGYTLVPIPFT